MPKFSFTTLIIRVFQDVVNRVFKEKGEGVVIFNSNTFCEIAHILYVGIANKIDKAVANKDVEQVSLLEEMVSYYRIHYTVGAVHLEEKLTALKKLLH